MLKPVLFVLARHITALEKKNQIDEIRAYLQRLSALSGEYKSVHENLLGLDDELAGFRQSLEQALQVELSSRQGFPTFDSKTLVDLGKEVLLCASPYFSNGKKSGRIFISLSESDWLLGLVFFAALQLFTLFFFFFSQRLLSRLHDKPSKWRETIHIKWLAVQSLYRNLFDIFAVANMTVLFSFFKSIEKFYFCYLSFFRLGDF